ncbi:MAG: hypothetical protein HOP15_13420 [Planctomycetes bacterium]|nr:hypothetical protein [Planctomycetota bacterium]
MLPRGDRDIKKFSPAGVFLATYDVVTEADGSNWIALAADQKTMHVQGLCSSVQVFGPKHFERSAVLSNAIDLILGY